MNRKLDYLCIADKFFNEELGFDMDELIADADDGEDTTVAEGKEEVLGIVDEMIEELHQFREDVEKLSYKKLSEKY